EFPFVRLFHGGQADFCWLAGVGIGPARKPYIPGRAFAVDQLHAGVRGTDAPLLGSAAFRHDCPLLSSKVFRVALGGPERSGGDCARSRPTFAGLKRATQNATLKVSAGVKTCPGR